jgi:hypothetical protein
MDRNHNCSPVLLPRDIRETISCGSSTTLCKCKMHKVWHCFFVQQLPQCAVQNTHPSFVMCKSLYYLYLVHSDKVALSNAWPPAPGLHFTIATSWRSPYRHHWTIPCHGQEAGLLLGDARGGGTWAWIRMAAAARAWGLGSVGARLASSSSSALVMDAARRYNLMLLLGVMGVSGLLRFLSILIFFN